jgi:predicted RNA-binding Zn-ribbon protein involved in translation (DUF1610 family)
MGTNKENVVFAYAGIICPSHGRVDIDYNNYRKQMRDASSKWKCPKCGLISEFDEERYDEIHDEEQ